MFLNLMIVFLYFCSKSTLWFIHLLTFFSFQSFFVPKKFSTEVCMHLRTKTSLNYSTTFQFMMSNYLFSSSSAFERFNSFFNLRTSALKAFIKDALLPFINSMNFLIFLCHFLIVTAYLFIWRIAVQ
jgi:hypothetical protein